MNLNHLSSTVGTGKQKSGETVPMKAVTVGIPRTAEEEELDAKKKGASSDWFGCVVSGLGLSQRIAP